MGSFVIAAYRPHSGKEQELRQELKEHVPTLRREGLVTDRPAYVMRAKDGTLIEVFEWKSAEAVEQAHHNPTVQAMWSRFEQVCTWVKLNELEESQALFSHFEPIDL
jgi:quinol monooxygenase YgiN